MRLPWGIFKIDPPPQYHITHHDEDQNSTGPTKLEVSDTETCCLLQKEELGA